MIEVEVIFPYEAEDTATQLTLSVGERLLVLVQPESSPWWIGYQQQQCQRSSQVGLFPKAYVKPAAAAAGLTGGTQQKQRHPGADDNDTNRGDHHQDDDSNRSSSGTVPKTFLKPLEHRHSSYLNPNHNPATPPSSTEDEGGDDTKKRKKRTSEAERSEQQKILASQLGFDEDEEEDGTNQTNQKNPFFREAVGGNSKSKKNSFGILLTSSNKQSIRGRQSFEGDGDYDEEMGREDEYTQDEAFGGHDRRMVARLRMARMRLRCLTHDRDVIATRRRELDGQAASNGAVLKAKQEELKDAKAELAALLAQIADVNHDNELLNQAIVGTYSSGQGQQKNNQHQQEESKFATTTASDINNNLGDNNGNAGTATKSGELTDEDCVRLIGKFHQYIKEAKAAPKGGPSASSTPTSPQTTFLDSRPKLKKAVKRLAVQAKHAMGAVEDYRKQERQVLKRHARIDTVLANIQRDIARARCGGDGDGDQSAARTGVASAGAGASTGGDSDQPLIAIVASPKTPPEHVYDDFDGTYKKASSKTHDKHEHVYENFDDDDDDDDDDAVFDGKQRKQQTIGEVSEEVNKMITKQDLKESEAGASGGGRVAGTGTGIQVVSAEEEAELIELEKAVGKLMKDVEKKKTMLSQAEERGKELRERNTKLDVFQGELNMKIEKRSGKEKKHAEALEELRRKEKDVKSELDKANTARTLAIEEARKIVVREQNRIKALQQQFDQLTGLTT